MEAVGVVALVGNTIHHAKCLGIELAEAGAEVFARCTVEAEAITRLFLPGIDGVTQRLDDTYTLFAQGGIIKHMGLMTIQRIDGLVNTDIA